MNLRFFFTHKASTNDAQDVGPALPFPTEGDIACISGVEEGIVVALGHSTASAHGESTYDLAVLASPWDFKYLVQRTPRRDAARGSFGHDSDNN